MQVNIDSQVLLQHHQTLSQTVTNLNGKNLVKLENHLDNLSFFGNEEIGVSLKQIKEMF